jgi:hypothetical protein
MGVYRTELDNPSLLPGLIVIKYLANNSVGWSGYEVKWPVSAGETFAEPHTLAPPSNPTHSEASSYPSLKRRYLLI